MQVSFDKKQRFQLLFRGRPYVWNIPAAESFECSQLSDISLRASNTTAYRNKTHTAGLSARVITQSLPSMCRPSPTVFALACPFILSLPVLTWPLTLLFFKNLFLFLNLILGEEHFFLLPLRVSGWVWKLSWQRQINRKRACKFYWIFNVCEWRPKRWLEQEDFVPFRQKNKQKIPHSISCEKVSRQTV